MTIWSAPDVNYLLDEHLKQARLELLADYRLRVKAEDDGGEDPGFVAELIVDKLEAAARAGFDAVEASLRASAAEYLSTKGLGVLQVRSAVATACERIVPPKRPRLEHIEHGVVPPFVSGALPAAAVITAAFFLHELGRLGSTGFAVAILASIALGYAITALIRRSASRRRAQLIEEWPARVCNHYGDALREGTAWYEHVIRTTARGGLLIPWR